MRLQQGATFRAAAGLLPRVVPGRRQMAQQFTLVVNGKSHRLEADPDMPLLYALRDDLGLNNPHFGCGIAQCGACTVHLDGQPMRSCQAPIGSLAGVKIATIESFGGAHPLQASWIKLDVPQCGYCQSGQLMSAAALLAKNPKPTDA